MEIYDISRVKLFKIPSFAVEENRNVFNLGDIFFSYGIQSDMPDFSMVDFYE
jgi:hypothetical protein